MKIIVISNSGEFLPIVWRLKREGTDVQIYVHQSKYKNNYKDILPKIRLSELKKKLLKTDIVIFDMTHVNEKTKQDIALLKLFGLKKGSPSVFGPVADKLKKDHKIIGSSELTETIELDRIKGIELAERIGFAIPEYHSFKTLAEGIKFLKSRKDLWCFKPLNNRDVDLTYVEKFAGELVTKMQDEYKTRCGEKIDYILQKKVKGIELSTEVWLNKGPVHFNHTLESKHLLNSDLGPLIGSQSNTVWVKKDKGLLSAELSGLSEHLRDYQGPCDVNCIISEFDKKPYFLEWTPRFGYDAFFALTTLIRGSLTRFLTNDFKCDFYDDFAAAERLTIPPFPYNTPRLLRDFALDVSILEDLNNKAFFAEDVYRKNGQLKCAGADGILGPVAAKANTIGGAWGNVYRILDKMKVCSYKQYRTDGSKHEIRYNKLKNWGLTVN